jgi:hypothetical protein
VLLPSLTFLFFLLDSELIVGKGLWLYHLPVSLASATQQAPGFYSFDKYLLAGCFQIKN